MYTVEVFRGGAGLAAPMNQMRTWLDGKGIEPVIFRLARRWPIQRCRCRCIRISTDRKSCEPSRPWRVCWRMRMNLSRCSVAILPQP